MKLRYFLKEKLNLSNGYIVAIVVLLLVAVIGGSYALFTTTSESKGALNIVTGDLKPYFESKELDSDNEVVLAPNEVKTISITMKNVNPINAKYNLYYSVNNIEAPVEVGYLTTGDEAPTTAGYTINKGATKTIKVRILNNHTENVTLNFGSSVGLTNDNLAFPTGKNTIDQVQSNVIQAYTYDEVNETTKCINGEEDTCVETTCLDNSAANSCPQGTIIRYAVNDKENKYFYVLHDDGATLTLQQRENTVRNIPWYSEEVTNADGTKTTVNDNTKGPLTILPKLEEATSTWTNVNFQEYTAGYTNFFENAFTGCDQTGDYKITCNVNTYNSDSNNLTLSKRKVRARMITAQEASSTGCLAWKDGSINSTVMGNSKNAYNQGSCPDWMHNYLYQSKDSGGSYDDKTANENGTYNYHYWTMSTLSSTTNYAWRVNSEGNYNATSVYSDGCARAVVVINK